MEEQKLEDNTLEALKKGHNMMTGDIVDLLSFTLDKDYREHTTEFWGDFFYGIDFVDIETIEEIEQFLERKIQIYGKGKDAYLDFQEKSDTIAGLIGYIKTDYVSVYLSNNITPEENIKKFEGLENVDLPGQMGVFDVDFLCSIFANLPKCVKNLKLQGNSLDKLKFSQVVEIFNSLPDFLQGLDLGLNGMGKLPLGDLIDIANSLPAGLTSLGLSYNEFNNIEGKLTKFVDNLPKGIKKLDFSFASLSGLNVSEIYEFMKSLPEGLLDLKLSRNELYKFRKKNFFLGSRFDKLLDAFSSLPEGLQSLDLFKNVLVEFPVDQLVRILERLPSGLKRLNLSDNHLGKFSDEELKQVFAAIPRSVEYLDLSLNEFMKEKKTGAELGELFSTLPPNLKLLNLSSNQINWRLEDVSDFVIRLPGSIMCLDLRNSKFDQEEKVKKYGDNISILVGKTEDLILDGLD